MSKQSNLQGSTTKPSQHTGARTTFASLAAIGSVLAASRCCLPILPFMMAAGLDGEFDLSLCSEAVSTCRLEFIYRLRVLPGVASEKMPKSAKRDRFCSAVGVRN